MNDTTFESPLLVEALRRAPRRCPELVLLSQEAGAEGWAVANHVGNCARCRAVVDAALSAEAELPPPKRWEALLLRAKSVFEEPTESIIRIVVKSVKRTLELVEIVGDLVEPVPIRNDERDGLVVRRTFGAHELTAHLAAEDSGRFTLMVDVWSQGAPSDDLRVTLLKDRRELESVLPRKGRVMFAAVAAGTYRVSVADQNEQIGAIDITFQVAV